MERIKELLEERKAKDLLRTLKAKPKDRVDFSSNDYLGLAPHAELKKAARAALDSFGAGSSASRLLSGDSELYHQLEDRIARFEGKESALVFNSGYQANVGIISALYGRGDVIFADRLSHASIIDGIMLSGAKLFRFKHNDPADLKMLLKNERHKFKNALVITETIFSMDGDRAPLGDLVLLKEEHGCRIMVDEAHATGVFGKNGSGVVEEENLTDSIDLIMGTFSKALGSFGAYLACSKDTKEYLVNICRSFIYSTALPPPVIAADLAALDLVAREPFRRKTLLENARFFREGLKASGFTVKGSSQIIPLVVGTNQKAVAMSKALNDRGYWVLPIRPPTVPPGQARLRFSLSYSHSKEIIEKLINDIRNIV